MRTWLVRRSGSARKSLMLLIEEANSPLSTSEGISSRKGPPGTKPCRVGLCVRVRTAAPGPRVESHPVHDTFMTLPAYAITRADEVKRSGEGDKIVHLRHYGTHPQ